MAEIELADLLAWMPAVSVVAPDFGATDAVASLLRQPVSWAVAARSGTPMLPVMRGGEVVVVSPRILIEQQVDVGEFAGDLVRTGCAAMLLLDRTRGDVRLGVPWLALANESRASAVESEINRLLTEHRGALYSRGTELGRVLLAALSAGATPNAIARLGAETVGIPMVVAERPSAGSRGGVGIGNGDDERTLDIPIARGPARLLIGPVAAGERALAALAGERVAEAIESAMRREDLLRPRGRVRAAALRSELVGESKPGTLAAIGLSAEARYRVVLASDEGTLAEFGRFAGAGVRLHEAGEIDGAAVGVGEWVDQAGAVLVGLDRLASRLAAGRWLVLSEAISLADLEPATGQARFLTLLLAKGDLDGPVVAFDGRDGLGPFRLLYRLRDDPELARFVDETLGELRRDDKRGVLRATLRAYLEAGGAGVETAARLGIHRNTLAYRLRRIAALTGRDPNKPEHWLAYGLALAADRLTMGDR